MPYLQCLHPSRLLDLVVNNRSVLAHGFVPGSQAHGILTKGGNKHCLVPHSSGYILEQFWVN